jgi:hypothetical protein
MSSQSLPTLKSINPLSSHYVSPFEPFSVNLIVFLPTQNNSRKKNKEEQKKPKEKLRKSITTST